MVFGGLCLRLLRAVLVNGGLLLLLCDDADDDDEDTDGNDGHSFRGGAYLRKRSLLPDQFSIRKKSHICSCPRFSVHSRRGNLLAFRRCIFGLLGSRLPAPHFRQRRFFAAARSLTVCSSCCLANYYYSTAAAGFAQSRREAT